MTKRRRPILTLAKPTAAPQDAGKGSVLSRAIAELRAIQEVLCKPSAPGMTETEIEAETALFGDMEDRAYEVIGRAPAENLAELRDKYLVMIEAMGDRIGARSGGASDDALRVIIAGTRADIVRLLSPRHDA